jgi:hypothetical protein
MRTDDDGIDTSFDPRASPTCFGTQRAVIFMHREQIVHAS